MARMDGEFGYVPFYTACRERNLPFVTRLTRPKLFTDPAFLARLRGATWLEVPDSLSGPRRAAADLGEWTLTPGKKTRRPDGSAYEPVTLRVVASIYPREGKAQRGRVIDGWQVELFAVDLPTDAWPAPEAVAAYFGRNGEENRFAQEDRELGLDRIVSYHLPGQELATVVGLLLWNLRLAHGFDAQPPPRVAPVQPLQVVAVDKRVPSGWPHDPVVSQRLSEVDWEERLSTKPGWSFDGGTGTLKCTTGRSLAVTTVRKEAHAEDRTGLIFRRPKGGCEDCDERVVCLRTSRIGASKHAEFSVPSGVADGVRSRLRQLREQPAWSDMPPVSGSLGVVDTLFLPAVARQVFAEELAGGNLRLIVTRPPPARPRPRLVAADKAARQHRRKTWAQNRDRYALPEGVHVTLEVAGSPAFRAFFGDRSTPKMSVGGSG